MGGGQRLISWLHPCSTSNVALNTRTCALGHSWAIQIGPDVMFVSLLLLVKLCARGATRSAGWDDRVEVAWWHGRRPVVLPITLAPFSIGQGLEWATTVVAANLVFGAVAPTPCYSAARQWAASLLTGWVSPIRTRVKGPMGRWWRDQCNTMQLSACSASHAYATKH
jgi:hypothetical protein